MCHDTSSTAAPIPFTYWVYPAYPWGGIIPPPCPCCGRCPTCGQRMTTVPLPYVGDVPNPPYRVTCGETTTVTVDAAGTSCYTLVYGT